MKRTEPHVTGIGSRSNAIHAVPLSGVENPDGPGYGSRYRAVCGKSVTAVTPHQPFVETPEGQGDGANCSQCMSRMR